MRRNFIFDPDTDQRLQALVTSLDMDMTSVVAEALRQLHAREFPPVKLGYIQLDRPGETTLTCAECDQPIDGLPYVIVFTDGTLRGPVCPVCAESLDP